MSTKNVSSAILAILRVTLGWLFLYAGVTKVLDPAWSAEGYIRGAKTFAPFFMWLAAPGRIAFINFINEWGLVLLGVSLIFGIAVRLSSWFGALLMVLYYLVVLDFPRIAPHSYLVDEHIIYALVLIYFALVRAGRVYGLETKCSNWPICRWFPKFHKTFIG